MDKDSFLAHYYLDRRNTNSIKWDNTEEKFNSKDVLPMWVADMDFKLADPIVQGVKDMLDHTALGYSRMSDAYYEAYFNWMATHFDFQLKREWLSYESGTMSTIYHMIKAFTLPNDSVIILSPVYGPFAQAVINTGRNLVKSLLVNESGKIHIDFEDFERQIEAHNVKLFLLCSPHNPVGRVWTEAELIRLFDICRAHGVIVVSDEIHQDFVFTQRKHIPASNVKHGEYQDCVITINAATKSFNMSGFPHANVILRDDRIRQTYLTYRETTHDWNLNTLNRKAIEKAYTEGEAWLTNCKEVIYDNYVYIKEHLGRDERIQILDLEGTYLCFVNLKFIETHMPVKNFMIERCRVGVNFGEEFDETFKGYIRINLATHPDNVRVAVERITTEINKLTNK